MLRNKSIFQISTLVCLISISICNLLIDLSSYVSIDMYRVKHEMHAETHVDLRVQYLLLS
jgi:hypothetical protein